MRVTGSPLRSALSSPVCQCTRFEPTETKGRHPPDAYCRDGSDAYCHDVPACLLPETGIDCAICHPAAAFGQLADCHELVPSADQGRDDGF